MTYRSLILFVGAAAIVFAGCIQAISPEERGSNPSGCTDETNTCTSKKLKCGSFKNDCGETVYCNDPAAPRDITTRACVAPLTYSCDDLGYECGKLGTTSCGTCPSSLVCGRLNTCIRSAAGGSGGSATCPKPVCPPGATCGTALNDCGDSVDCGKDATGLPSNLCPNATQVCVLKPTDPTKAPYCCTPKTPTVACNAVGQCGMQDDGCGGKVDCSKVLCGKDDAAGVCGADHKCAGAVAPPDPPATPKASCTPPGALDGTAANERANGTLPQYVSNLRTNTCEPSCAALIVWNSGLGYEPIPGAAPLIKGGYCASAAGLSDPRATCVNGGTVSGVTVSKGTVWDAKNGTGTPDCVVCCITSPGPLNDGANHLRP